MPDSPRDDRELKRAIALSLQGNTNHEVIDLLSDDGHDAITSGQLGSAKDSLREPDGASNGPCLKRHKDIRRPTNRTAGIFGKVLLQPNMSASGAVDAFNIAQPKSASSGLVGLDRRKMEEDRQARARKRNVSISPPPLTRKSTTVQDHSIFSFNDNEKVDRPAVKKTKLVSEQCLLPSKSAMEAEGHSKLVPTRLKEGLTGRQLDGSGPLPSKNLELVSRPNIGDENSNAYCQKSTQPQILSHRQQMDLLAPGMHFPNGVVKKTWAYGYPRKDDIKIEEVLQKDSLEVAVLSAFQWDEDWIMRKVDLRKTKVICVVQAEGEVQKANIRANAPPMISFCFPSMAGQINCMHSKLQLLFHSNYLRIVVPSANLTPYDWGEDGGIMENTVFIIDLPKHPNGKTTKSSSITSFGRELSYFLKAIEMDRRVLENIMNFDFSQTAHMAFVHSIGGSHSGSDWKRTGYCGLGSAIRELGLSTKNSMKIDFVSASIGSLNYDFIKSIYLAAQGDDGTTELNWRINRPTRSKLPKKQPKDDLGENEARITSDIDRGFRIYFPSRDTVERSKGGIGAGGTICFQSKWYNSPTFPSSLMRDCKSKRPRLLMHNKLLFVRPDQPIQHSRGQDTIEYLAWAYIGSANLSESAWGRLVKDKTTKLLKLNIRNWECGVVIPVIGASPPSLSGKNAVENRDHHNHGLRGFGASPPNMTVFEGRVPVPMVVPGEEYGVKRPWFYAER